MDLLFMGLCRYGRLVFGMQLQKFEINNIVEMILRIWDRFTENKYLYGCNVKK